MKKYILLSFILYLSGCTTYLAYEYEKRNPTSSHPSDKSIAKKENKKTIVDTVGYDINMTKKVIESVIGRSLSDGKSTKPPKNDRPSHLGADSNLCKNNMVKICSYKNGCTCEIDDQA